MLGAASALLAIFSRWRRHSRISGRRGRLIAALCIYVLLKGGYNLAFVSLYAQGHWYFPLSILIFNLLIALWIRATVRKPAIGRSRGLEAADPAGSRARSKLTAFVITLAMIIYIANAMTAGKDLAGPGGSYTFWMKRQAINNQMGTYYNGTGILEFEDGLISYSSDKPTMSGIGFALDLEAAKAKQSGKLLQLAYDRGFRLIGTIYYGCPMPNEPGTIVNAFLDGHVYWLTAQDLKDWQFILRYRDPESGCEFIEFKPR